MDNEAIITEKDIPVPSHDFPIEPHIWQSFRDFYVGKKAPPQKVSDRVIRELGCSSWKAYYIDQMASFQ